MSSTSRRVIASPRPVPPYWQVIRVIRLFERLEQALPSLRHNTHSGVAYFEEQHYILVAFLDDPGSQDD